MSRRSAVSHWRLGSCRYRFLSSLGMTALMCRLKSGAVSNAVVASASTTLPKISLRGAVSPKCLQLTLGPGRAPPQEFCVARPVRPPVDQGSRCRVCGDDDHGVATALLSWDRGTVGLADGATTACGMKSFAGGSGRKVRNWHFSEVVQMLALVGNTGRSLQRPNFLA
jgi:hypothetical protein